MGSAWNRTPAALVRGQTASHYTTEPAVAVGSQTVSLIYPLNKKCYRTLQNVSLVGFYPSNRCMSVHERGKSTALPPVARYGTILWFIWL